MTNAKPQSGKLELLGLSFEELSDDKAVMLALVPGVDGWHDSHSHTVGWHM